MSDDSKRKTLRFNSPTGTEGQIDALRSLIPGDWQPVEDADSRVLEVELGIGLPRLRIEESDGTWKGILIDEESGERLLATEDCDSHTTAALHLRERLENYGRNLKERAEKILSICQTND